jgi:hypothetical protein
VENLFRDRVSANSKWLILGRDDYTDCAKMSIIDRAQRQPAVTLSCEALPDDEPLLVYFHPAGDFEMRDMKSTDI